MDNTLYQAISQVHTSFGLSNDRYKKRFRKTVVKRTLLEWLLVFGIMQLTLWTFQAQPAVYLITLFSSAIIYYFRGRRSIVPLMVGVFSGLVLWKSLVLPVAAGFAVFNILALVIAVNLLVPIIEFVQVKCMSLVRQ